MKFLACLSPRVKAKAIFFFVGTWIGLYVSTYATGTKHWWEAALIALGASFVQMVAFLDKSVANDSSELEANTKALILKELGKLGPLVNDTLDTAEAFTEDKLSGKSTKDSVKDASTNLNLAVDDISKIITGGKASTATPIVEKAVSSLASGESIKEVAEEAASEAISDITSSGISVTKAKDNGG
jgi:hypothetical protein